MTNDKELIERLALKMADKTLTADEYLARMDFATRFLDLYLAERGQEAVGWFVNVNADFDPDNPHFQQVAKQYEGDTDTYQLFLAPQQPAIPEGMALVPIEPTEAMLFAGHMQIDFDRNSQNTFELDHPSQTEGGGSSVREDMADAWKDMIAAAG